jgi:catechol 2,3-dioxygenase-like lactoylglutathione lyase family enzyme
MKLDHIGIRVPDLDATITLLTTRLGFELVGRHAVPLTGAEVAVLRLSGVDFEIFEDASCAASLDHLALRSSNLDVERERLRGYDVLASGSPIQAPRNATSLWLDAATVGGLRIHLIEHADARDGADPRGDAS